MSLRILIDLLGYTGRRGGTETYAREIIRLLPDALPDAELIALVGRSGAERVRSFFPGDVHVVSWVGSDRATWAAGEILAAPRAAARLGVDVIWSPANFGPITRGRNRVTTVHDLIYHDRPGLAARITARLMDRTAITSDAVITGSRAAEERIVAEMGVPRERVTVIPHGTTEPAPPADPWTHLERLGIRQGRPVLLSSGNRLPHKNFEGLLRAIAEIPPAIRPLAVIAGGPEDDPLRALVGSLDLESDVILPGWVTDDELESLYAVADVYACPSLQEGFGLPVIDAMRRGCAVIANDILVLREVGGAGAHYADAQNPTAFAAAISEALTTKDPDRDEVARTWASEFTWERSARRTADVLAATGALPGRRRA